MSELIDAIEAEARHQNDSIEIAALSVRVVKLERERDEAERNLGKFVAQVAVALGGTGVEAPEVVLQMASKAGGAP